jgi:hypothetical protein
MFFYPEFFLFNLAHALCLATFENAQKCKSLLEHLAFGWNQNGAVEQFLRKWEPVSRPELRQIKELKRFG